MKATLEFDLEDSFDRLAHIRAISATNTYIVLYELDSYLRQISKHSDDEVFAKHIDIVHEKLHELMEIKNINLNDLE